MSTITRSFGQYTYTDDERGIQIIMKEVEPEVRGKRSLSAHIQINGMTNNRWQEIITARNGISTLNARSNLRKSILRELKGDPKENDEGLSAVFGLTNSVMTNDWYTTIKDACEGVTKIHNAGNPPVDLYSPDLDNADIWRIPGLLAEDINVIYGKPSSGKSYLSVIWGQAIQHGVDICGLPTVQGNVLLIDYETTPAKMARRFKRVDAGLGITRDEQQRDIIYIPQSIPVARNMNALRDYVREYEIDFIIIDSLARAVGGSLTDDEAINVFFENIRELQKPCLIIHHTNRSDEYYGSNFIHAYARSMWRLRSVQSEGRLSIHLEQEKENDGASTGNIGFALSFYGNPYDPDTVELTPQDSAIIPELRQYMALPRALQGLLSETVGHRMYIQDIKDNTQINWTTANSKLFDSYIWDLRREGDDKKFPTISEMMRVEGDYLILNSIEGEYLENDAIEETVIEEDSIW